MQNTNNMQAKTRPNNALSIPQNPQVFNELSRFGHSVTLRKIRIIKFYSS